MRCHGSSPEKGNWQLHVGHQREGRRHTAAVGICTVCWGKAIFSLFPSAQAHCLGTCCEIRAVMGRDWYKRDAECSMTGTRMPAVPRLMGESATPQATGTTFKFLNFSPCSLLWSDFRRKKTK